MVTEAGGFALPVGLAAIATAAPPAGAAAESVMVQVMLDPEVSGVAGHISDVTVVGAVSAIEALADDPPSEAVIVEAELTANAPVLRVNDPLDAPCGTRMDAGTVAAGELDASRTVAPPVPAAPLRVTEQAVELEGASELLLQVTAVTCTGAAAAADGMPPPVVESVTKSPVGDEASPPVTPIEAEVAEEASVTATVAITPSEISLALRPVRTQLYAAAVPAQVTDFPAAAPEAPTDTLMALRFAAG
jgi:hypothetical protein